MIRAQHHPFLLPAMSSTVASSSAKSEPSPHFVLLDGLRGIAAIWIFIFHIEASQFIPNLTAALPKSFNRIFFEWGQYSVLGFFVLSGFVIAHSLRNTTVSWHSFKQFCQRRLVRLTPPYYTAIFLFFAIEGYRTYLGWQSFPIPATSQSLLQLLTHLLYLQELAGFEHYSEPYWTICLEVQFYLSFILLLGLSQWLQKRFSITAATVWVFGGWTLICLLYNGYKLGLPFYRPIFISWHFSFLLGVYAYWSWQKRCHPAVGYGYGGLVIATAPITPQFAIAAAATSSFILAAAQGNKLSTWLGHKSFQFLGQISYSLYLTHLVAMSVFSAFWMKTPATTVGVEILQLLGCIGFGLILATAIYYLVEKPSIQWSKRLKTISTPAASEASVH